MSGDEEVPEINVENQEENMPTGNTEEGTFRVPAELMKDEEAKLKAKYGGLRKPGGGSALLQKRLQKGQKFFDSGDYNMAKAKMNNPKRPLAAREKLLLQQSIGGAMPTPTQVENIRRPSQIASNLLLGRDVGGQF